MKNPVSDNDLKRLHEFKQCLFNCDNIKKEIAELENKITNEMQNITSSLTKEGYSYKESVEWLNKPLFNTEKAYKKPLIKMIGIPEFTWSDEE